MSDNTALKKRVPLFDEDFYLYLKCFGVAAGLMALIYLCIGVPFLGNSVLVLDLNGQYVYFFESLHNIIYDGDASMLWSWQRALGGEYMGIYAYYLASPLSWIVALLPKKMITESLWLMILTKVGLAGTTMGCYLHKTYPTNKRNVVLFSTLYALCSWSIMYGNNVMWLDTLLLFPLVIRGADLLLSGRNYLLYTAALAMTILTHYYMGYMVCLFLILYFFWYHIFRRKDETYNPKGRKAHFLRSGLSFILFSLIAAAIAAVIILPAAYSLTFGKDTFTDPTYEFSFKLTFLDILFKLMPFSVDTVAREGLPFIYCGSAALIGAFLFFASGKVRIREKYGAGVILLLLCLCFSVSVIDIWWHGGQEPNWLNYRYSFMFSFLLLVFGYRGYAEIGQAPLRRLVTVPAIMLGLLVILQAFGYGKGYEYTEGLIPHAYDYNLFFYFLGFFVIGGIIAALMYYKKRAAVGKRAGSIVLCALVLGEAFLSGVVGELGLAVDVGFCGRASYVDFMKETRPAVDYVLDMDTSFYRMDKTFHRQQTDAMALGMRSMSISTSTLNKHTLKLLEEFGYAAGSYWSQYSGGNPVTDMLFDIKYVLTKEPVYDGLYQRVYTDEDASIYGYLNPYALSLGYAANGDITGIDFEKYETPMELINDMTAALTGNEEARCFVPITIPVPETENVGVGKSTSTVHTIYTKKDLNTAGTVSYTFNAPTNDLLFLYFPTDYPRDCTLLVDGKEIGVAMGNESDCILPLGRFKAGSTHIITLSLLEEKAYVRDALPMLWSLDEQKLGLCYNSLKDGIFRIADDFTEDDLSGSVTMAKDGLLFTSIPYDKGWQIWVDGDLVKPLTFEKEVFDKKTGESLGNEEQPYADALIVLPLDKGTHELRFRYLPDCVVYGRWISLGATVLLLLIVLADYALIRPLKKRRIAGNNGEQPAPEDPAVKAGGTAPDSAKIEPTVLDH